MGFYSQQLWVVRFKKTVCGCLREFGEERKDGSPGLGHAEPAPSWQPWAGSSWRFLLPGAAGPLSPQDVFSLCLSLTTPCPAHVAAVWPRLWGPTGQRPGLPAVRWQQLRQGGCVKCGGLRTQERTALFSLFSFPPSAPSVPPLLLWLALPTAHHTHIFCTQPDPNISLFYRQEMKCILQGHSGSCWGRNGPFRKLSAAMVLI